MRGEDWNATDLQWKIETSCVSVCLWCDVRGGLYFFKAVPTTPNDLGLARPLSLYKWLVWWRFGDLKRTKREREGNYSENETDGRKRPFDLKEVRTWAVSFHRLGNDFVCVCRPADTRWGGTAGLLLSNTCTASWTRWSRRAGWARSLFSSENKKLRPARRLIDHEQNHKKTVYSKKWQLVFLSGNKWPVRVSSCHSGPRVFMYLCSGRVKSCKSWPDMRLLNMWLQLGRNQNVPVWKPLIHIKRNKGHGSTLKQKTHQHCGTEPVWTRMLLIITRLFVQHQQSSNQSWHEHLSDTI